ncbi:helix-turn-helix domain-containing protein [Deinococcus hopiensis]|uniref:Helix-turn-helix domain-containing protein n=1 Tax=Deinococcus hopiensis KR-140 TaxID=695939 RepID=A0A1W1UXR2_9DEIO|nr:helix-turn-helix transcriptional regulator [Deinococcus hopiensis]SMB85907.1 Helix-turn-helix domain-containing protein [Deinococcus hopiensis KR-140]
MTHVYLDFPSTGTLLREARDRAGLTQRDVARLAFGDEDLQSLVSRYETDLVEPSLANLRRLAPVLRLSLGDFAAGGAVPAKGPT